MKTGDGPAHQQRRREELTELMQLMRTRMRPLWRSSAVVDVDLTMPQIRALDLLAGEPHRMSDLAAALGTSLQATTSLIDRLVDKALVERIHDPADRRVVICRLTSAGNEEMERFYRISQGRMDILVDLLTDDELDTIISAFRMLADAALRQQLSLSTDGVTPTTRTARPAG